MSYQQPKYPKVTIPDVLKEFFFVAKKYKLSISVATIGTIISIIAGGIIVPIYYKNFFDLLTKNLSTDVIVPQLIHIILVIFAIHIVGWIAFRSFTFACTYLQVGIMTNLRQLAYDYTIGHGYAFFSNTFSGSLVQRINRFMRAFERVTDRFFYEIIPIITRVVGVCIVLWYTNPIFTLAIIIWLIVFFAMSVFFSRWKLPYDIKSAEVESHATGVLSDSLSNHTTIQLFNRFSHESSLFGEVNNIHTTAMKKKWNMSNLIDGIQAFMNISIEFVIFFIAVKYWGAGAISVGTFVLIQIYVFGLMDSFWSWSRILRDMYESFADAKEMVEIMKLSHSIKDSASAKALEVTRGEIDLEDVQFAFNEGHGVLDHVSLNIAAGERVALIGPSGAGKSTLVRLLLRFYDIQNGSIKIDGQDIRDVKQGSLREAISFVPQDPILFHRSLKDNIKYGKTSATDEEVISAAKLAHCHEFISQLPNGYDTFVGERGIKLSGGERQRVAIARAILKNAPILVLDEATSSLDSHSEALIQDALDVLMKGKTVVVIAHRLSTIRKMNRIVVIDHGKIIEQGMHDSLVSEKGMYAKLWSLQSQGFIKYEENKADNINARAEDGDEETDTDAIVS